MPAKKSKIKVRLPGAKGTIKFKDHKKSEKSDKVGRKKKYKNADKKTD